MRRRAFKLRQFSLGGAKANSTHIGSYLQTYFVVGDSHNNVRLYTFESEEQIATYANQSNHNVQTEVTSVALSCTEKEIFSGTNRGIINVWDMQTAKAAVPLRGHSTSVNCFGIYPQDPARLVSGSYDTFIKLWDIRDKNCTATLKGHGRPINSLDISPDGNLLLSGSEDCTARLWQLRMGQKPIYVSTEHSGPVLKVKFNPEDCMFATCSADKTAKYFRCEDKCFGFASSTQMVSTPITSISYSEDGKYLYTASNDVLKSWNMYKGGVLVDQIETNWKGVQDLAMIQQALMGIAFEKGHLSLWVWDVKQKIKNTSRISQGQSSIVLPKISHKNSKKDNDFDINQIKNIVDVVNQKVSKMDDKPSRQELRKEEQQKRKAQMQRKKEEFIKKKEQQEKIQRQKQIERQKNRERERLQKMIRDKEQKERKQQQRKKKEAEDKKQQERLYLQRLQRQERLKKTFQQHAQSNTMEYDDLQNSLNLNISTLMGDGVQKEKMKQMEMIGQILKERSKFQESLHEKKTKVKPIINYWKMGKTSVALDLMSKSDPKIVSECVSTILTTPLFKQSLTIQNGTLLTRFLKDIMKSSKHSIYVTTAMQNINVIVLIFKQDLIRIKTFNVMAKVDLSQEERLAKYDKMVEEFMNVFREERLKKYSQRKRKGDSDDLCNVALQLYKNLEQVLIKIMPKQEPQLA